MNHIKASFIICIVISQINGEDYENIDDEASNKSASVDSESNEVYNSSILAKPKRNNQEMINVNKNKGKSVRIPKVNKIQNERKSSYPFAASIQKKHSHYASGALIDTKWILTAAGEFYNVRESIKIFRARLGSVNCKKGGFLVALKGVEVHPLYFYNEPQYDIALLRLAQAVTYNDHIKPIAISSSVGDIVSAKFLTTYWPRLIVDGQVLPASAKERLKHNSMRVSTQKLLPWNKCHKLFTAYNKSLEHSTLCLEPIVTHHSPCIPDVGAPVIADDVLWGITSGWISEECHADPSPTLFTRISEQNARFWLDSMLLET